MSFSKVAADIRRKQIAQEVVGAILRKKAAAPVTHTLSYRPGTPDLAQSGRASGQTATPARSILRSLPTYTPGIAVRSLLGGQPYHFSNRVLNTLGRAYNQAKPPVDPKAAMLEKGLALGKGALDMLSSPETPYYSGDWNSPEAQELRGVISDYWGPKFNAAKNWLTSRNHGDVLRGLNSGHQAVGRGLRNIFSK